MRKIAIIAVALLAAGCEMERDPSTIGARGGEVRLVVVPPMPAAGTVPRHVLVNDAGEDVGYGHPYVLERRTGDGWRPVESPCLFTLEGLTLEPAERSEPEPLGDCRPQAPGLVSGVYRLRKEVDLDRGDDLWQRQTLEATFMVL